MPGKIYIHHVFEAERFKDYKGMHKESKSSRLCMVSHS